MSSSHAPFAFLALVVLTLPSLAGASDASAAQPSTATVVGADGHGILAWTEGAEVADSYNVYGLTDSSRVLIGSFSADARSASVPAGFSAYGVSATKNGVETAITPALGICVAIDPWTPTITIGCMGIRIGPIP